MWSRSTSTSSYSVSLDLFGSEMSSNAADYFTAGSDPDTTITPLGRETRVADIDSEPARLTAQ